MKERSKGMARGKLEKLSLRVLCQRRQKRGIEDAGEETVV